MDIAEVARGGALFPGGRPRIDQAAADWKAITAGSWPLPLSAIRRAATGYRGDIISGRCDTVGGISPPDPGSGRHCHAGCTDLASRAGRRAGRPGRPPAHRGGAVST